MTTKAGSLKKPSLSRDKVIEFAEGKTRKHASDAPVGQRSGLLPDGDVRLTANIRADLHMALRMRAVQERTTAGELIEAWIESWAKK